MKARLSSSNRVFRPTSRAAVTAAAAALAMLFAGPVEAAPERLESWYDFEFHGKKVGFLHSVDESTTFEGKPAIHAMRRSVVTVRRERHVIRMESLTDAWCGTDGTPLEFKHVRVEGGARRVIEGRRSGQEFLVKMNVGGSLTEKRVPLTQDVKLASTLDALLKPGLRAKQVLQGKALVEEDAEVRDYKITVEKVSGRGKNLVYSLKSEMSGLISFEKVRKDGRTLSTVVDRLGAKFTLTTREKALALAEPTDIFTASRLSSHTHLPRGDELDELVVRLVGKSGRAPKPIESARQKLKSKQPDRIELAVLADAAPKNPPKLPMKYPKKLTKFTRATPYEPIGDQRLISTAKEQAAGAKDAWAAARKLNAFVYAHITNKSLAQAFSTATEALTSREGDCTEHAVLFSALAKTLGIPTRLVTGLVYVGGSDGGFGYHEWVEVWMGKRWIAMDPTFGQDIADPTHIKFTHGLSDAEGLREAGVVAAELFGDIDLEIVSYLTVDGRRVKK